MSSVVQPRRRALGRCVTQVGLAFSEARPVVIGVFALRFAVGGALAAGLGGVTPSLWLAGVSWTLAVWGVYLVNGISDIEGDRLNGSARPLASGRLSERFAVGTASALLVLSVLLATPIPGPFTSAVLAFIALGLLYSLGPWAAKNVGAAALVVAAAGIFLTYVAAAHVVTETVPPSIYAFALVASSWIAVTGHTKDFGDVAGDAAEGRKTLPVVLGERRARIVVAMGTAVVSMSAIALAVAVEQLRTLLFLGVAGPFVVVALLRGLREGRQGQKRPYQAFMAGQYALNVAALLAASGG
jgi:4-hydroxybenzoate polyprenyltransferase